ncbi:uncharacterized protein [Dermacentor andersoni]|uniref:uncharacterized protein n=1 Tax=Dermacentor andersoni TaxID=34620 RepID=UPI003B3A8E8C
MPDRGQGRVHRFRDHVVAGVNWRPTRFVDEVPNSRVCGLCRMIPKETALLPCSHAMCQSCYAAIREGEVGQCPLDQVQFDYSECFGYEFPARLANTLKVYCWNEQHGCEYTGTMDRMLQHYEKECTFHTVECLRCGEGVQHSELPRHYVAGCSAPVSAAITECPPLEPSALTLEDVNAAFEDLKAVLRDASHDRLLSVTQSQLNELTEQARNQEARFAEITRAIGASEFNLKGGMAEMAATISSTVSHQLSFLRNPLRSEKALILRKLKRLADLKPPRQTSSEPDSSNVIAHCSISSSGFRYLTSVLSTEATRIREIGTVDYVLTLKKCEEIIRYPGLRKKFAEIMVWHMRDTYFTVTVFKCCGTYASTLTVEIEFNGMLVDSRCWRPFWHVGVKENSKNVRSLTPRAIPCFCSRYDDSLQHFHFEFYIEIASLKIDNFLRNGTIEFNILLSVSEIENSIKGEP